MLLAACSWPMAGQGPDRRGWSRFDTTINPANADRLGVRWSTSGLQSEIVGDGTTLLTTDSLRLRALDQATGTERWSVADPAQPVAIQAGEVVSAQPGTVCTVGTRLLSTGAATGSVTLGGTPELARGVSSCSTAGVMPVGGVRVLSYNSYGFGQLTGCDHIASKTTADVVALDANLRIRWRYEVVTSAGCGSFDPSVINTPGFVGVSSDGLHVFTTRVGEVIALPLSCAAICVPSWTRTLAANIVEPPVILTNGDLAVRDAGGPIFVLDPSTGATKWTASAPWGALAANADTLFVSSNDRVVRAFRADGCGSRTCVPAWTATMTSFPSTIAIAGDVLYTGSTDGLLQAFDARGCGRPPCTPIASIQAATGPVAEIDSIAVIAGRVFVAHSTGITSLGLTP